MNIKNSRKIAYIGIAGALVFVLGSFEIYHLPQGGGISLYQLPIIYISLYMGITEGIWTSILGAFFSILKNFIIVNPWQILLDYFLPNLAFVLVAFFKKNNYFLSLGIILAYFLNFSFHFLSGVLFFLKGPWAKRIGASFTYNLSYTLPEMLLVLIVVNLLLSKSKKENIGVSR